MTTLSIKLFKDKKCFYDTKTKLLLHEKDDVGSLKIINNEELGSY